MRSVPKVKTAVVGCGMISDVYIHNLQNFFSIIDVVALCDHLRENAEEKARLYGVKRIVTMEDMMQDDDVELVVNLTGPQAHYEVTRAMLSVGKHVFTEKPLAPNLEQAQALVCLAEEKNLYLGAAPDTILGAGVQTARKLLDAGMIGRVTSAVVTASRDQSLNAEVYRFLRENGGAFPWDIGIYALSALFCLLGSVTRVSAMGMKAPVHGAQVWHLNTPEEEWQIPGLNLLAGTLLFENGTIATLHFDGNVCNAGEGKVTLYGTEGVLQLSGPENFGGTVRLLRKESGDCIVPFTHGYNGENVFSPGSPMEKGGHRGVGAAEMAWAIRMKRPNRCSGEYALHAVEVLHGLETAAQTGRSYDVRSRFSMKPLHSGYTCTLMGGKWRGDAERSLVE